MTKFERHWSKGLFRDVRRRRRCPNLKGTRELPVSTAFFFLPSLLLYRFSFIAFPFSGFASSPSPRCSLRTTRVFMPPGRRLLFATPCRIRGDRNFNSADILPSSRAEHRSSFEGVRSWRVCVCVRVLRVDLWFRISHRLTRSSNTSHLFLSLPILPLRRIPILWRA